MISARKPLMMNAGALRRAVRPCRRIFDSTIMRALPLFSGAAPPLMIRRWAAGPLRLGRKFRDKTAAGLLSLKNCHDRFIYRLLARLLFSASRAVRLLASILYKLVKTACAAMDLAERLGIRLLKARNKMLDRSDYCIDLARYALMKGREGLPEKPIPASAISEAVREPGLSMDMSKVAYCAERSGYLELPVIDCDDEATHYIPARRAFRESSIRFVSSPDDADLHPAAFSYMPPAHLELKPPSAMGRETSPIAGVAVDLRIGSCASGRRRSAVRISYETDGRATRMVADV